MELKLVGLIFALFVSSALAAAGQPGYFCNADADDRSTAINAALTTGSEVYTTTITGLHTAVSGNTNAVAGIEGPCNDFGDIAKEDPSEKIYYVKYNPDQDYDTTVAVTLPTSTNAWNTRIMILSQVSTAPRCGTGNGFSKLQFTCELREADMCQGYPNPTAPVHFFAGRTYYIILDTDTAAATEFELKITKLETSYTEDFESGLLPTGWTVESSGAPRSWHVGNVSDQDSYPDWHINNITTAAVGGVGNYFLALNPLRNDPVTYTACKNNAQLCNHTDDWITTPAMTVPNSQVFLTFDTYFYNGVNPPTEMDPDSYAFVEISVEGAEFELLYEMPSKAYPQWYVLNIDITEHKGKEVQFRFHYQSAKHPPRHGWLINDVQLLPTTFDLCGDSYACTQHTCSIDAPNHGCSTTNDDTYCESISVNCMSNICNPAGATDPSGCSFTEIAGFCDDTLACTHDYCNQTVGCYHTLDDDLCDDGKGCTTNECVGNTTQADSRGCYYKMECDDKVSCTIDTCVNNTIGEDKCLHTVDFTICEDFIDCTYELTCDAENPGFDLELPGCIRIPMHEWCDDQDACTIDTCDPTLNNTNSCVHTNVTCDDCLECTMDYCDDGNCFNIAQDFACDDQFECTVDICDTSLGKCTNTPNDTYCGYYGDLCHNHYCRPWASGDASGCVSIPIDCTDGIPCSDDTCDEFTGECVHTSNDTKCEDNLDCTDDVCNMNLGKCTNIPNSANCDDGLNCTVDFCDMTGMCDTMPMDCTDDIHCTVDFCDETLGCVNHANDSNCDDGWECTVDTCDTSLGKCTNLPSDAHCTLIGDPCYIHFCNPESSSDVSGCYSIQKVCDDGLACTYDWCNSTTGECQHDAIDSYCDDGFECTNDVCDTVMGRCTNYANDTACDDNNACTVDVCGADGQCHYIEPECNDQIACTDDWCDPFSGRCHSDANDTNCDDGIPCTRDFCDAEIGRCVNIPYDSDCDGGSECTEGICSVEDGRCIYKNHDEWCDDWIGCTVDTCLGDLGCSNSIHDSLCDDGIGCTEDFCNVTLGGCQYQERDDWCGDTHDCTENICTAEYDCIAVFHNVGCDDQINCTSDYCDADGCHNVPMNTWCSDGHGCTEDICNPDSDSEDKCDHIAHHSLCDDGFDCSAHTCDLDVGCMVNYTDCPWYGLGQEDTTCINCHSRVSSIEVDSYTDGSGAMKFSTLNADTGLLSPNMVLLPSNAVIIGANGQEELAVAADDGLVVKEPLRLVPLPRGEGLPVCNEVKRGSMVVVEVEEECGPAFCHRDVLYVCVKNQEYEWVPLGDSN